MRYVLKKIRGVRAYDIATGVHKFSIAEIKNAQLTGTQDTIYAEGSDGSQLAAFDTKKTAGFKFDSGLVSTGVLAAQTGGTLKKVENGTDIQYIENFTIPADATTVTLKYLASGTAGSEIGFIYAIDDTGERSTSYAQADSVASAKEFVYDATTGVITLPTSLEEGDNIVVDYFPTFTEYNEITNDADTFSITAKIFVDAWFTDTCDDTDVPIQIYSPKGKISGAIDLSFGDAVATQSVEITSMANMCPGESKTLWTLREFDLTNASVYEEPED